MAFAGSPGAGSRAVRRRQRPVVGDGLRQVVAQDPAQRGVGLRLLVGGEVGRVLPDQVVHPVPAGRRAPGSGGRRPVPPAPRRAGRPARRRARPPRPRRSRRPAARRAAGTCGAVPRRAGAATCRTPRRSGRRCRAAARPAPPTVQPGRWRSRAPAIRSASGSPPHCCSTCRPRRRSVSASPAARPNRCAASPSASGVQRHRRHPVQADQAVAAGDQDRRPARAGQQRAHLLRVDRVVEHDERPPAGQLRPPERGAFGGAGRGMRDSSAASSRPSAAGGSSGSWPGGEAVQVEVEPAVRIRGGEPVRDVHGQAGLADARHAVDRDRAGGPQQLLDQRGLRLPAGEVEQVGRQVVAAWRRAPRRPWPPRPTPRAAAGGRGPRPGTAPRRPPTAARAGRSGTATATSCSGPPGGRARAG